MSKISKIKVGGTRYNISDEELSQSVETLAEVASQALNDLNTKEVKKEHVYVVCRACSGTFGSMQRVSTSGGYVYVKLWNPATYEEKDEVYSIPSNGVVEMDIPCGWVYQVHSELGGKGASFRQVHKAFKDANYVHLWNLPTGVYKFGWCALYGDDGEISCRLIPVISTDGTFDPYDDEELSMWDMDNADEYDYNKICTGDSGAGYDDMGTTGIVVSTQNCSFLVGDGAKAGGTLAWSNQAYGRSVPGLDEFYETCGHYFDEARSAAAYDLNGALNSEKILDFLADAPAAEFACKNPSYPTKQCYLPSAGELLVLYNNKSAYNNIQANYSDVPAIDTNNYWSSTAYSPNYSWRVDMGYGFVSFSARGFSYYVLAFSAFSYIY